MKRTFLFLSFCVAALCSHAEDGSKYLFAYFTGNAPDQEQICYALSDDGYNYLPINGGRPIVMGDSIARTGCVRDPHLLRGNDGWFYMVVTDMRSELGWASNRGIVLMRSRNLIHWQHHTVHFPEKYKGSCFANVTRVWAPQTLYDAEAGRLMVYFSLLTDDGSIPYDRVYWQYANADFSDLEGEPQVLFDYHQPAIDTDIVRDDAGVYHLFFKTEADGAHKGIRQYTFTDLHHPDTWTLHDGFCETTDHDVEGAGVFRLKDGNWCLMYDCYMNGCYQFTSSPDLMHFSYVQDTKTSGAFTPRHGTVILISSEEARRLCEELRDKQPTFRPGKLWLDNRGEHINAHGGGIMKYGDTYYWYGEHKADTTSSAMVGVTCYSSTNLADWTYEGVALPVSDQPGHDIEWGCILERPKVVYNAKTGKFVMWFHLELKDRGYWEARYGVAVSDTPVGPFQYLRSGRVNPGKYAVSCSAEDKTILDTLDMNHFKTWYTPEWQKAVEAGMFMKRDMEAHKQDGHSFIAGQMARDQTVYIDDDGRAYHIYSSEENLTLQVAELSDDYTAHTGRYTRVAAGGMNEAPALFKKDGTYWMITSGCTGWEPNDARMFSAPSIWGPWKQHPNPCVGPYADKTFGGQSTFILSVGDKFIFMADIWRPDHPSDARYIWLPIQFKEGKPVIEWKDMWQLFDN